MNSYSYRQILKLLIIGMIVVWLGGCLGAEEDAKRDGDHTGCTMTANQDGTIGVLCPDGETGTVFYAPEGEEGVFCTISQNESDAERVLVCRDGTEVAIRDGEDGPAGEQGVDGSDGALTLVRFDAEPAGQNCVSGGYVIEAGLDLDEDGRLSDDEVTSTQYVCHGEDGPEGPAGSDGPQGDEGAAGEDGASALVRMETEPEGDNCAAGGIAILAGIDANRDGVLADDEVTSTSYVCNGDDGPEGEIGEPGEDGASALVRFDDEPAGANCPNGGIAVHSGIDLDADEELSDEEITSTTYICHGADGTPGEPGGPGAPGDSGSDGKNSLIRLDEEPPGPHCPSGGFKVLVGLDDNGNDELDDAEIDHTKTSYICHEFSEARGVLDEVSFTAQGYAAIEVADPGDGANVNASAIQDDGKIVLAGHGNDEFTLVRLNHDGSLDTDFGVDGIATLAVGDGNSEVRSIVVLPDEKLLAAGLSTHPDPGTFTKIWTFARFEADGTLDTTFGDNGVAVVDVMSGEDASVTAIALDSQQRVVVVGTGRVGIRDHVVIARLSADGALDASYGTNGVVDIPVFDDKQDWPGALTLTNDDSAVVVGSSYNFTVGEHVGVVIKVDPSGQLDSGFNGGFVVTDLDSDGSLDLSAVVVQSDGKLVAGGYRVKGSIHELILGRLLPNGDVDTNFGTDGLAATALSGGANGIIKDLVVQSNGKLVAAGESDDEVVMVRYNPSGLVDTGFGDDGNGEVRFGLGADYLESVAKVHIQQDNKLVVTGLQKYVVDPTGGQSATPLYSDRFRAVQFR